MRTNFLRGLGIALITPFKTSGEVDYTALERLVEYHISEGADFFCILATSSEAPTLSTEEKRLIKQTVIKVNKGRLPIVMACGGNNTAEVARTLRATDFTGVQAILSVCPYYNKPTQAGLYQHFKAIAQVSPLPIVLYNVPGRTGVNLSAETTVRLASECENIIAIKEASGNIEQADNIIKDKPDCFNVVSGEDALTFPMVASGATGVISVIGNVLPKVFSRMIHLELDGQFGQARVIHHSLTELFRLMFVDGSPAGVKAALSEMGMIENILRLPLSPVRKQTQQAIAAELKHFSLH